MSRPFMTLNPQLSDFQFYKVFDAFFNRASYANQIAEEIQKETGKEATTEDIIKYMDDNLGSLDNEELKTEVLSELKGSFNTYIQTLGKHTGTRIFNEDLDEMFELLKHHTKHGHEALSIENYIEVLNDQDAFLDVVRRNADWIRVQNQKRVKYFEDLISSEMDKVRANALLNELADKGLYMSLEDMENYMKNGVPPKEIFNNITKEIYKLGSKEYAQIYQDYFEKYNELKSKLNPKKTGIIDDAYQKQIDDLEAQKQAEIDKLVKKPPKTETGEIKGKDRNKTFSITEAVDQLANDEYVELKIDKDSEPKLNRTKYPP
jgi:hypothetical protein